MKSPRQYEDSSWCLKLITTISICGITIALGICTVIHGATLLQLQSASPISMADISYVFPAFALGNVLGTIPAGLMPPSWSGRRRHCLGFLVAVLGGAMMALIPNTDSLAVLLIAFAGFGFTFGYYDTDVTTIVTDIWGDDSPPYLVAVRSCYSLGVFIGGFLSVPFVVPIPEPGNGNSTIPSTLPTPIELPIDDHHEKLHQIYYIGMGSVFVTSLVMLIMLTTSRKHVKTEEYQRLFTGVGGANYDPEMITKQLELRCRKSTWRDYATVLFFCATVATTMATTAAFCNFIVTFTVVYLEKSQEQGAWLVSLYGGCTLLSNFVAVLLVKFIKPSYIIAVTSTLCIIAFFMINIAPHGDLIIWLTTALFGLGNIPTVSMVYVTAERYDYLSNAVAGCFSASTGVAALLSMTLVSGLFSADPMVVMYFGLSCAIIAAVAVLLALTLNNRQEKTKNLL